MKNSSEFQFLFNNKSEIAPCEQFLQENYYRKVTHLHNNCQRLDSSKAPEDNSPVKLDLIEFNRLDKIYAYDNSH